MYKKVKMILIDLNKHVSWQLMIALLKCGVDFKKRQYLIGRDEELQ